MKLQSHHLVEIGMVLVLLTVAATTWYMRAHRREPEYLKYVSDRVRQLCLTKAERGEHNIGFIGGKDAEYYVALEDCVRDQDPDAFKQVH